MSDDQVTLTEQHAKPERFIRKQEVLYRIGISEATLWVWIRNGTFPPSYKLGEGYNSPVAWKESEIDAWIATRQQGGAKASSQRRPGRRAPGMPND